MRVHPWSYGTDTSRGDAAPLLLWQTVYDLFPPKSIYLALDAGGRWSKRPLARRHNAFVTSSPISVASNQVPLSICFILGWFRFALSQWETALLYNDVSHWLCAGLESALSIPSPHWTKCPTVRRHFQRHLIDRKVLFSDWHFTEVSSSRSNWQVSIGFGNGLVPIKRLTNNYVVHWPIYSAYTEPQRVK